MKKILAKLLPTSVTNSIRTYLESKQLRLIPTANCNLSNLRTITQKELQQIFANEKISSQYQEIRKTVDTLDLPSNTGGVNIGDQRALYHLIAHLKPKKVLEIGTFVGCSTVHIALALKQNGANAQMTTVDINDVNNESSKPWKQFGSPRSPYENLVKTGCEELVNFVHQNSVPFLENTAEGKFDFIFLDGGHKAVEVYQEVALALNRLSPDGVILLHDYFPDNQPLWDMYTNVIAGPYLAMKRLNNEGNNIDVVPLGALPWNTKYNTTLTSLALCSK